MWSDTKLTSMLGIDLPIVQGPFGGKLSSVQLTSVVSNAGGLGSYGCQPFTSAEIVAIGRDIRQQTNKPFNLNLWVNDRGAPLDDFDETAFLEVVHILQPYFKEAGVELPPFPLPQIPTFDQQIDAIFAVKPDVFSFVFGIPSQDILEKCRQLGIRTVGAATTVDEAIAIENAGVDAVVATGFDAGGHRVSFIEAAEDSLVGTFSLIPQIADAVRIPVIAAGGIADLRGVQAAFILGADAVQIGSAFLATAESGTTSLHREKLFSKDARYTTLTKVFTGRLSRGIKNRLTEELKDVQHRLAPYPIQGQILSTLGAYPATAQSNSQLKSFWAGQASPLIHYHTAIELIESIVQGLNNVEP
ncbi:NAD(P)H-dependent flavin oxidoreductase [Sphingobacterium suaedae]|uniref:Propionate 3-nitronate monooxygenase n=1 Tax=Sphingobacterium suaedae TaxID=1686402 RepID=A0ABW5KKG8_9SPHI